VAPRRATFPEGPAWQPAAAALRIGQRIPRVALAKIGVQPVRRALRALETVEKVLTGQRAANVSSAD